MVGKAVYLKKLTSKLHFRSIAVGTSIEGTSPPAAFIGSWNYPKVYVGPMLTPQFGDTSLLDTPEAWIPTEKTPEDIVQFRLQLVRGKEPVKIHDLDHKLVQKLQEISLASTSVESEAEFKNKPRGFFFNEEHQPFGPSAALRSFGIGNVHWQDDMEKVYYDTDLKAGEAVVQLYKEGLQFTEIQKAFSVGTMGLRRNRKLVPTRWSITAVDDTLGKHFLEEVRHYELLEGYEVYEFEALNNYFAILFTPTPWQYEFLEAFIHVMGEEEVIFSDWEGFHPRTTYASIGGCYYAVRFACTEKLRFRRKQAGAIIFREAYPGYIPLGVFTCRETARHALTQKPKEFSDLKSALNYISTRLRLPFSKFHQQSALLKETMQYRQMQLARYF